MKTEHLALMNLVFCAGIFWACICRLNSYHSRKYKVVRARYTMLLAGAMVMGLQPTLLGTWPGIADVVFSASVLIYLGLNMYRWRQEHADNQP